MEKKTPMLWHQILGQIWKELLPSFGIEVLTEVSVMIESPRADILLLRRRRAWTQEQRMRLPDGIRDSEATHILVEFKATESLTKEAFIQAQAYEHFYKQSQKLTQEEVQTFILCAKQPLEFHREKWGYTTLVQPGIYRSDNVFVEQIQLISLNELPDTLNNAWITCLASRKKKREKAFALLKQQGIKLMPTLLYLLMVKLWRYFKIKGDDDMGKLGLTPEEITEMNEMWGEGYVATLPLEKRLAGANPADVMSLFNLHDRLVGANPADVMSLFQPTEILANLSTENIEAYLEQRKKTEG